MMSDTIRSDDERRFELAGGLMFVGTVFVAFLVSYLEAEWRAEPLWRHAMTLSCGLIYLFLGTYGLDWAEGYSNKSGHGRGLVYLLFAVQVVLAIAIIFVGYLGNFWLVAVPLAGFSVGLGWRGSLTVGLALIAGLTGTIWHYNGLDAALRNAPSFFLLIGFVMLFSQVTASALENRAKVSQLAAELRQANQQLREYAMQVEDLAVAKERNRLAREIHDGLGHYLTVVNIQLEAARTLVDKDPVRAEAAIGKAQKMAQEGLADVRRSVATLRESPVANRAITDALADLVAESNAAGVPTTLNITQTPRPLPAKANLTLYRAAQEALTNIRKHAAATQATVTLTYRPEQVNLKVADNGRGSDRPAGGFGLLGIRERVLLLNGDIHIQSAAGQGFVLELDLPAPPVNGAGEEAAE